MRSNVLFGWSARRTWRPTLEEFRAVLDASPWIRAELRQGGHPHLLLLTVSPKYRRDIKANMLTFWLTSTNVTVIVGTDREDFESEDKLKEYLAEFVETTAFPNTVAEFRAIQSEDVYGMLRVKSLLEDDPADVPVLVDATGHNNLAKRALENTVDTPFDIGVVILPDPGMTRFEETTKYRYLESGGFGLHVIGQTVSGRVVRLRGDIVPLGDLPT